MARATRDRCQVPPAAAAACSAICPADLQQLEPAHLVRGPTPSRSSASIRTATCQPPSAMFSCRARSSRSSLIADVRHQQLGEQFAARPGRDLAGPPGQVEQAPGGGGRVVQHQPGGDGQVAVRLRGGELADRASRPPHRHADLGERGARAGQRAAAGQRQRRVPVRGQPGRSRPRSAPGVPLPVARGRNSTGVPSAPLTAARSPSRSAPATSARSTASRPCWARPERPVGAAADLPDDRLDQPGQVGVGRDGDQRDVRPPGDVHRGHRGLPLLGGERRHRAHPVDRRPAQRHVQPVVGDLGRRRPGQQTRLPAGASSSSAKRSASRTRATWRSPPPRLTRRSPASGELARSSSTDGIRPLSASPYDANGCVAHTSVTITVHSAHSPGLHRLQAWHCIRISAPAWPGPR